ncbi:GD17952 [Drosophila simulans]|uniref:GD17952 n=1 Tax=Drosophila simulans TaxID=7240 RepID=B4QMB9_DROSI|nr:GD17952 [Drosophila simulans]
MAIAQARRSLIRHGHSGGGTKGVRIYLMIKVTNHIRSLDTCLTP